MLNILYFAVFGYLFLGAFYSLFLAYACIQDIGWSKVPLFGKVCVLPIGVVFYLMDLFFNATVGSLVFLQAPTIKTATFSMRLKANIDGPDGWRKRWSALFVDHFLLPFTKNY